MESPCSCSGRREKPAERGEISFSWRETQFITLTQHYAQQDAGERHQQHEILMQPLAVTGELDGRIAALRMRLGRQLGGRHIGGAHFGEEVI